MIASSPWRWPRSVAFGLVGGFGAVGHGIVTGAAPPWAMVALATCALMLSARAFAHRRLGRAATVTAVGVGQALLHAACFVVSPVADDGRHAAMHTSSLPTMLLVHVGAAVLGAAIILRIERAAWTRAKRAATTIGVALASHLAPRAPRRLPLAAAAPSFAAVDSTSIRFWLTRHAPRRGPPSPGASPPYVSPLSSP